jgi:plasmid maintenance system antidote protein VapI
MPQLRKMYAFTGKPMPHLGKMLEQKLTEKRISKAELARQLNVNGGSINQYIGQSTLHAALLWKIGQILEFDFFAALSAEFPKNVAAELEISLQQQLTDLKKENDLYQKILVTKLGIEK